MVSCPIQHVEVCMHSCRLRNLPPSSELVITALSCVSGQGSPVASCLQACHRSADSAGLGPPLHLYAHIVNFIELNVQLRLLSANCDDLLML